MRADMRHLPLTILSVALLLSIAPTVSAVDICNGPGAVWAAHSDGSTTDAFQLGEAVWIKGADFPAQLRGLKVSWLITDPEAPGYPLPGKPLAWGTLPVGQDGSFFVDSGWSLPLNDYAGHKYILMVYKECNQDNFFVKWDIFHTIPEFTSLAIPGFIAIAGYLFIRRRKHSA